MTSKEFRRGAALEEIEQLQARRIVLKQDIDPLKKEEAHLREHYQPLIDALQPEADRLAREFRRFYEESQEAFALGDGELAKTLSLEGKAAQEECESLNLQLNRMRTELKALHNRLDGIFRELGESRRRIETLEVALRTVERPSLGGFNRSLRTPLEIEKFLDTLPQRALRGIEHIEFIPDRPRGETGGGKLGDTRWDPKTKRAFIRVYRHEYEFSGREYESVAHEVAHEIFLKYLTHTEKKTWEDLYAGSGDWFVSWRARRSVEEDFCECLAAFFVGPGPTLEDLASGDSRKYTFIESVVKRLETQP